jgi:hypothetical protein
LLEARNRVNLPLLVVGEDEKLLGFVTERELIHGITEKRGPNGGVREVAA